MPLTINPINPKAKKRASFRVKLGVGAIVLGVAVFLVTYYPIIAEELRFAAGGKGKDVEVVLAASKGNQDIPGPSNSFEIANDKSAAEKKRLTQLTPVDENFGIVVPKIGANRAVVADVDPFNKAEYHLKLRDGVAHSKGSALPGEQGNMFIFSHSSVNFYETARYNTVFYLLDKMEKGDKIYIAYKGKLYTYAVTELVIVKPSDVKYLDAKTDKSTLSLMTCVPVGTSLNRLLVNAELVSESI